MANFIKHTSCDRCGSSDARALYSDGGWYCFSCKASSKGSFLSRLRNQPLEKDSRELPEDVSSYIPPHYMDWFSKYELSIETLIASGVKYSKSWDRVFFTWPDVDVWQSRKNPEKKIFTSGNHDNCLLLYGNNSGTCVLTEDPVSAIKIASLRGLNGPTIDAMPLLGTHLPSAKLRGLKRLYSRVDVFLDHDKGKEAMQTANRLRTAGLSSTVYVDRRDPKEIPYNELRNYFNANQNTSTQAN